MIFTSEYDGQQNKSGFYNYNTSVNSMNRLLPPTPLSLMPGGSTRVLTEYLRLGPKGGIGPVTWHRADAGPGSVHRCGGESGVGGVAIGACG